MFEVARTPSAGPQVVVVVAGHEPDTRCDHRIGGTGTQGRHELGEGGRGIGGRGECELEHVPEHDQLWWVGSRPQGPQGLAQRDQDRGHLRVVDAVAVDVDRGEKAVQSPQVKVRQTHPSDASHRSTPDFRRPPLRPGSALPARLALAMWIRSGQHGAESARAARCSRRA